MANFHINGDQSLLCVPNLFKPQIWPLLFSDSSSQDTDELSSQQVFQLKPEQEVRGHPLGPASLILSPHQLWLASAGRDGLLRVRETASMVGAYSCNHLNHKFTIWLCISTMLLLHLQERYIELQCHLCCHGGIRSLTFSADSQTLLTTSFKDGSLVCANLR